MADYDDRLKDYKDVPARIADFKEKHPEGVLRPLDPAIPYRVEHIGNRDFIVFVAAAYKTPDDPTPGVGTAWEPFPGTTPYTKNSELQNAETSAWGRAIVAALASESKNIASAEDVRNRSEDVGPPMATKSAVHVLVEQVKDTPLAQPIKAWMAENNLSFTQPLTLDQFKSIEAWVSSQSAAAPAEPETPSSGDGGRAEQFPPPAPAPAVESSSGSTHDEGHAASSQVVPPAASGSVTGGEGREAPSSPDNLRSDLRERIGRLGDAERLKLKALWTGARLAPLDSAEVDEDYFNQAVGLIGQAAA